MRDALLEYRDHLLIKELERRGYVVRHVREAQQPLSWHRTAPFPDGVDFRSEAVEKLREQITPDHVAFTTRESIGCGPTIHSATLRVLR